MNFKYASYIVGLILFTGVIYMLFNIAGDGGEEYNSRDYGIYQNLTGSYNYIDEIATDKSNSTLRKMQSKLEIAQFTSIAAAVGALDNALEGTKLMFNSIETTKKISNTVMSGTSGYVDPYWFKMAVGIISVLIVLMVLYMLMRAKGET